jgi:hypothetical protein
MKPVDPLSRKNSQSSAIVSSHQHLGLKPSHLACGRGLGVNSTPSNDLPHHRIERQTISVIHIIISRQSPENRLPQQPDESVQPIVTCPRVSQQTTSNVVQAEHLIQFPQQQQSSVQTDFWALKF